MTVRSILILTVFLGVSSSVCSQWFEDGEPAADTAWRKAWGKHGAMLHLTDKPDEFFEAWDKPGEGVPLSVTDVAKRGEPLVGVVLFTGCAADESGNCDAEVAFQVFKPDGSPYSAEERAELWTHGAPVEGQLQLSVGSIGVRIELQDPSGTYSVRARLRDKVSGAEVELTQTFSVETDAMAPTSRP